MLFSFLEEKGRKIPVCVVDHLPAGPGHPTQTPPHPPPHPALPAPFTMLHISVFVSVDLVLSHSGFSEQAVSQTKTDLHEVT